MTDASRPAYVIQEATFGPAIEFQLINSAGAAIDVSAADVRQVILRKPSGAAVTKTAAFSSDGTDGKIRYVWGSGDLDEAGVWKAQPRASDTGVYDYYGRVVEIKVEANL